MAFRAKRGAGMTDADGQEEMFDGANVSKLEDGDILASLSAWARCFGTSRETLQNRLVEANVTAKGKRQGYPLYGGRDVFSAWISGPDAPIDPDALPQFQRKAFWETENLKLTIQLRRGELVPAIEVEQTMGKLAKMFALGLDTLLDTIERDVGLQPMQAAKLEQHIDRLRENLYQAITAQAEEPPPAPEEPKQKPAAKPKPSPAGSVLEEAIAFLKKAIAGGPQPTGELVAAAKKAGISEGTLRRAKAQLGKEIVARREGRGWVWSPAKASAPPKKKAKARKSRKR